MQLLFSYRYTLNKNTLKTLIKRAEFEEKQPIIAELCVVYGYYFSFRPYKTHISYTFCRQPISSPYHGHNYSYLMLTNFIGSSYMSDFSVIMLPIQSCIWVYSSMDVVCVFLFRVYDFVMDHSLVPNFSESHVDQAIHAE